MPNVIDRFDGTEHDFLSNFHPSPITMPLWHPAAGHVAPTVEHAFQAAKTEDRGEAIAILHAPTPGRAKRMGRATGIRAGWDEGRDAIMLALLRLKFAPFTGFSEMLMATGDAVLIEGNTWGDVYWGVCDGVGANHLGRTLMQIRAELTGRNV